VERRPGEKKGVGVAPCEQREDDAVEHVHVQHQPPREQLVLQPVVAARDQSAERVAVGGARVDEARDHDAHRAECGGEQVQHGRNVQSEADRCDANARPRRGSQAASQHERVRHWAEQTLRRARDEVQADAPPTGRREHKFWVHRRGPVCGEHEHVERDAQQRERAALPQQRRYAGSELRGRRVR
jgi:hypothetical protein